MSTEKTPGDVITEQVTLRYDYALGEVAGRFMSYLNEAKILATRCSRSALSDLPPRAYRERRFQKCDAWVEAGLEGVIEASTIVVRGFEGKRPPPVAIAFLRLNAAPIQRSVTTSTAWTSPTATQRCGSWRPARACAWSLPPSGRVASPISAFGALIK